MRIATATQKLIPIMLGLAITVFLTWMQFSELPVIQSFKQRVEYIAYDFRLNASLKKPHAYDTRIVIVDVDEKSLGVEGRWPWSRGKIAELTDKLFDAGAVVVGYDIFFSEPERNSLKEVLQRTKDIPNAATLQQVLSPLTSEFDNDQRLAESLSERDTILGYLFHEEDAPPVGQLPPPLVTLNKEAAQHSGIKAMSNYTASLPLLQNAAATNGFVTNWPDADGIIRRTPMVIRHGNDVYGSLSLEMAKLYMWLEEIQIKTAPINDLEAVESIILGGSTIPTDGGGFALVPYRGPKGSFPYISATDVLNNKIEEDALEGAIVIIGSTAVGIADLVATPISNIYPGVEIHATMISAILDNQFFTQPSWTAGANFTITLTLGIILALLLPFLSPLPLISVSLISGGSVIYGNFWLWQQEGFALALAWPLILIITLIAFNITYGYLRENHKRTQLKNMFGQYVPPELVETMMEEPDAYGFEGESREMTVLFADIRGFTTLSEKLSPSELRALLNRYFTHMTEIIFKHHGTIDKYVGDMIMSFWGAPVQSPSHANNAIDAAMEMLRKTDELRPQLLAEGYPNVDIGIGLNTGMMNVGDMGSSYRRAYTVLGDNVNLGSRIEGLTKYYGVRLVVGENTRNQPNDYVFRTLDLVKVKGKTEGVHVYEPICHKAEASQQLLDEIQLLDEGLAAYRTQQWQQSTKIFTSLLKQNPEVHIYSLYLDRIEQLQMRTLSHDWDGVYERREK